MRKILVADDNAVSRELIREALESEGYGVVEAVDGLDTLEKISKTRPDLVLLDVQMPRLDGFAVLRSIRENSHLQGLPVLALTAFAMQGDADKALDAGFDGYITKPVQLAVLRAQVEAMLRVA